MSRRFMLLAALFVAVTGTPALAVWSSDPLIDTPVTDADENQFEPATAPHGATGLLAVWRDARDGSSSLSGLRAQCLDDDGNPVWALQGVRVCTVATSQETIDVVTDGAGGMIVVWTDSRTGDYDVYAQRIDVTGTRLWGDEGLPVAVEIRHQYRVAALADGAGGVFLAWDDARRTSGSSDIYLQRLDADGNAAFAPSGMVVSAASAFERHVALASDGAGGVVVAWSLGADGVWAARVHGDGTFGYSPMAVSTDVTDQANVHAGVDGVGGAIVAWRAGSRLGCQRLTADGDLLWGGGTDVPLTLSLNSTTDFDVAWNGDGGMYATWYEYAGSDRTVRLQRLSAVGSRAFSDTGLVVDPNGAPGSNAVVIDGDGNALVAWTAVSSHVLARKVLSDGSFPWGPDPILVSGSNGNHLELDAVPTANGGMIVSFELDPFSLDSDVMAQHVLASGDLGGVLGVGGVAATASGFLDARPVPFRTGTTITVDALAGGPASVTIVDVAGRAVRALVEGPLARGRHAVSWDGRDHRGRRVAPGVYYVVAVTAAGREVRPLVRVP